MTELTDIFDEAHADQILREDELLLDGHVYDVRLALSDELPPTAHVTTAHCLAFDRDRIALALHVTRSWIPPGGHLEPAESPEDTMRREALEEAGIEVAAPFVLAYERIEIRGESPAGFRYPRPGYQVFFVAELIGMGPITATDECTETRLFEPETARELGAWMERNRGLYEAALEKATLLGSK